MLSIVREYQVDSWRRVVLRRKKYFLIICFKDDTPSKLCKKYGVDCASCWWSHKYLSYTRIGITFTLVKFVKFTGCPEAVYIEALLFICALDWNAIQTPIWVQLIQVYVCCQIMELSPLRIMIWILVAVQGAYNGTMASEHLKQFLDDIWNLLRHNQANPNLYGYQECSWHDSCCNNRWSYFREGSENKPYFFGKDFFW